MVAMLALADAIDCLDESSFMPDLSYFSVFLLGLLGGFHCAGMCGGIVVLLNRPVIPIAISAGNAGSDLVSMQARVCEPLASVLARQIAYSLARVGSYSLAGGLMGALGSSALLLKHILPVEQMGFVLVNALMLAFALYLWGWGQSLRWLEPAGRWLWWQLVFFGAGCPAAWCMACCSRRSPVNMRLRVHCFLQVLALVPCLILSRWA
ncbi:MAG: sulfite exporter TauE/SafE family protein [Betaproteobacteria bacterium]|nr:sulfite exporter TauE/SafE family protein [Betaproteobacteria bacterium]